MGLDCDSVLPLRRYRAPISSRVSPPVQGYRAPGSKEAGHARRDGHAYEV